MNPLGWPGMPDPEPDDSEKPVTVDERWLPEYVRVGIEDMAPYLKKHAEFAAYLDRLENPQPEGDAA